MTSLSDLRDIVADALTSFSPLATLVGADSLRAFNRHISSPSQCFASSLAPIGALGLMSTIAKASRFRAFKELLGVADCDVSDAAADLGLYVAVGGVRPGMDRNGQYTPLPANANDARMATALVEYTWQPGLTNGFRADGSVASDNHESEELLLHIPAIQRTLAAFSQAGIISRATSRVRAHDVEGIQKHVKAIRSALTGEIHPESRFGPLKALNDIENLQTGSILVHWPAPAMTRVTSVSETLIFSALILSCFIILFAGSVSPRRLGISPGNEQKFGLGTFLSLSSLLFLGHGILLLVHLLCRLALYRQLEIVSVEVPQGWPEGDIWRLLDGATFPTSVATRPWSRWYNARITGGPLQFRSFRRNRIPDTHAISLLFLSAAGFICFYIGARASGAFLVGMYIALFIIANLSKTIVLLRSNKASCDVVSEDCLPEYPTGDDTDPLISTPSSSIFLSCSVNLQTRTSETWLLRAISQRNIWVASAQLIFNMVSSHVDEQLENPRTLESQSIALLEFPLYTWSLSDSPGKSVPTCRGVLQLGIQGLSDDEIFWFLVQEYQALVSTIMREQPEQEFLTPNSYHEFFIYSCIRTILAEGTFLQPTTSESYEAELGGVIRLLGPRQLFRSIRSVKLAANGSDNILPLSSRHQMTLVAVNAFEAESMQSPIQDASIEEKKVAIKQLVGFESWVYGPDYNVFRVVQASGSISQDSMPIRTEEISALKANLAGNDRMPLAKSLVEKSMESTPFWITNPYSVSKWRLGMTGVIRIVIYATVTVLSLSLPLLVLIQPGAEGSNGRLAVVMGMTMGLLLLHLFIGHIILVPYNHLVVVLVLICSQIQQLVVWVPHAPADGRALVPISAILISSLIFMPGPSWASRANFQASRSKLLQRYPKQWFHDKFDLGQLNTSDATSDAIAYPNVVVKKVSRLYHLLALYYLPSKRDWVTLPDPAAVHSRYPDVQSQLEEYLDIFQALERRVWSLMFPWNWHSRDDNIQYLSERLILILAHLQLIINQMEVLGVELGPFGGDDIASEDAFVAAVHREVEKLIERRKKLEREVEEMSRMSQSSYIV